MKKNWVRILGVFFLLGGLVLGLAPATVLAQAQVLDRVVVSPASVALAAGGTQQFAAQGYDVNNVAIPGLTYFWAAAAGSGTITAAGLFTAGSTPGTYTNSIQAIGIQGSIAKVGHASVTITAGPGPLDHVTVTPATATLQMGGAQQFAAQGYDANNVAIPGLTYFWAAAAGSGSITATGLFTAGNTPGTYANSIQASAVQGSIAKVGHASVVVTSTTPGPLDHVTVTPATATVQVGGIQQFTAQGYDVNNVAISGLTYFWAAAAGSGSITATGLFTAGNTPGTYTNGIQASAVQGSIARVGYASVTITSTAPGPLDHVTVTPATASVQVGATRQFSAQGYDANNVAIPGLTYFWAAAAGSGSVTATGLFTAGNTPGTYANSIQASAVQGSIARVGYASVTITSTAPAPSALATGTKRLLLLVAASLRGIGFENFLGAQWSVRDEGTIRATPGVVKAISNTSLTLLPNGQTQTVNFALTADTVVLAKDRLRVDERAVVVTVNDQTRLVVEVPIPGDTQRVPPGLRKLDKALDKFVDRFIPPGWDKGKKTGWDRDWDWDDDDDDDDDEDEDEDEDD